MRSCKNSTMSNEAASPLEAAIARVVESSIAPLASTIQLMNSRLNNAERTQRTSSLRGSETTAFPSLTMPPVPPTADSAPALTRKSSAHLSVRRGRLSSQRSLSTNKKVLGEDTGMEDGDQLDPVMTGDLISLKHTIERQATIGGGDATTAAAAAAAAAASSGDDHSGEADTGFLAGDTAYQRCGVQLAPRSTSASAEELVLDFSDAAVFRVVPMLPYRQRNELEALEAANAVAAAANKRGRAASTSGSDGGSAEALLRQRVQAEEAANASSMASLERGGSKEPLKYGVICQLQHAASGLFLRAHASAAPIDPECRLLTLGPGSSATYLRVMPKFKAQTEGSIVYHTHSVVFEAVSQRNMFLHASTSFYDNTPSPTNASLPKNLRTGRIMECNVSPAPSTFVLRKFARVEKKSALCLQTGQPFRLFHSQSDAFVQASCDAMKGEAHWREDGQPLHAPYLRALGVSSAGGSAIDDGSSTDPTNPANQSVKGLWCLEFPRRAVGGAAAWGGLMRVRHVASGLYLSVDHSTEDFTSSSSESWFTCRLVDDAKRPRDKKPGEDGDDEEFDNDDEDGYENGSQRATPESMLFKVFSADKTEAEFIPSGEASIQLEHHFTDPATGEKRVLYLHNSEQRKARRATASGEVPDGAAALAVGGGLGSVLAHSFRLVFSSVKSAQDIFKFMSTLPQELWTCRLIKTMLRAVNVYAEVLIDSSRDPPQRDYLKPFVALLLRSVGLCLKGESAFPDIDWIKKANSLAPAAFSALFSGEPNPQAQRVCRDMKLMDAVFKTGLAPYQRTYPTNPWGDAAKTGLSGALGVQKLVHVCLQTMCAGSAHNQAYFGRRFSIVKQSGNGGDASSSSALVVRPHPQLWMDTLLEQLEDALGPAVTLSKLLSSSEELLKRYATPKLVLRFADMVKLLGPQRRLIDFFSAICLVQGKAVKANQEMVLRLTWMRPEVRRTIYLQLRPLAAGPRGNDPTLPGPPAAAGLLATSAKNNRARVAGSSEKKKKGFFESSSKEESAGEDPGYGPVSLPSGAGTTDGRLDPKAKTPGNFIGRDLYKAPGNMFPVSVGVTWTGMAGWGRGKLDNLFWDADSLGIDNAATQPRPDGGEEEVEQVVRLEELCWVLDPAHLCEAITGEAWESLDARMEADPTSKDKLTFGRKVAFATYFVGQLKLHTAMCSGRSYNCIRWLENTFASYETLASMGYNPHLPRLVRAAAVDLVNALYLDRFPQLHSCGKPSLPEQLWVYEMQGDEAASRGRAGTMFGGGGGGLFSGKAKEAIKAPEDGTPLVRPLLLEEDGSLPCFTISTSHTCFSDPDPFNSFPSHFKFFILRNLGNMYFKGFGDGCLVHSQQDENSLASSVCTLIASLLSFGFQSHKAKLEELVPILVQVLDGRTDVESVSGSAQALERIPFSPLQRRYTQTSVSPSVTGLKVKVLACLKNVTQIRTNFRLANALATFQEMNSDPKQRLELKRLAYTLDSKGNGAYEGPLVVKLFEAFEDNFMKGGGALLMLETLGKANVDTILLDCLMYDDDALFGAALEVLEGTFTQRRQLLDALRDVILQQRPVLSVFDDVATMSAEIGFLTFLTRSYSVWGVCSRVSGPFGPDKYEQALTTLDRLAEFFLAEPFTVEPPAGYDDDDGGDGLKSRFNLRGSVEKAFGKSAKDDALELIKDGSDIGGRGDDDEDAEADDDDDHGDNDEDFGHDDGSGVTKLHQDVARSINLQVTLFEGLYIDYNLAFRGSICTPEEKAQSRAYLVEVQRRLVAVLETFVTRNPTNQALVWNQAAKSLAKLLGPLTLPPWPEDFPEALKQSLPEQPGLGVEGVVVECLRGHEKLCTEAVPRNFFEAFGYQLNGFPDPSLAESQFEFFEIVARPKRKGIARNQNIVVEVFLSDKLPALRACVDAVFGGWRHSNEVGAGDNSGAAAAADEDEGESGQGLGWSPACGDPARVARLLSACVADGNVAAASALQRQRFNMDVILSVLLQLLEEKEASALRRLAKTGESAGKTEEQMAASATEAATAVLVGDRYVSEMLVLVHALMECLVVDPRLFRRRGTWRLLSTVCAAHLRRFSKEVKAYGKNSKLVQAWVPVATACAGFGAIVIGGSRAIGFSDLEHEFEESIRGPGGLVQSALAVFSSGQVKDARLRQATESLVDAVDASLLAGYRQDRKGSVAPAVLNLTRGRGPSIMGAAASSGAGMLSFWKGGGSNRQVAEVDPAVQAAEAEASAEAEAEAKAERKALRAYEDPTAMLKHFVRALQENPKIKNKLQARRFQFALVLETIESRTDPHGGDGDGSGDGGSGLGGMVGAVKVTWPQLVDRMVRFAVAHNFDSDEVKVIRIYNALRSHLMRARSSADGKERDPGDLSEEEMAGFRAKQSLLDARGVVTAACRAIATHSFGNALAASALDLLSECLNTGNPDVQASVLAFVKADPDAKLVRHFRQRMEDAAFAVRERKERTSLSFEPLPSHLTVHFDDAMATLRMLQLLCEGHNQALQDMLREQPWHSFSVNLAAGVTALFVAQAETLAMLRRMEDAEVEVLAMTLDCLVEMLQGPCPGNQELFSRDDAFLNALDKVLQSNFHPRVSTILRLGVKSKSVCLLAALLEGRHDRAVHNRLMAIFEPAAFEIFQSFLAKTFAKVKASEHLVKLQQLGGARAVSSLATAGAVAVAGGSAADIAAAQEAAAEKAEQEAEEREEVVDEVTEASVCLERVRRELSDASPEFALRLKEIEAQRSEDTKLTVLGVAQVEVMFNGRVEAVTFALPPEHKYLSEDAKEKFLHSGDVSTVDKRGKRLMRQAPIFIDEMVQVYALAESSKFYGFLHRNLVNIKWSMYALVVLLNLNIVMASYGAKSKKGYASAAQGNQDTDAYNVSLVITWVLGMINVVGYVVIVTFLGITEIPIVIRQVDHFVAQHAHWPSHKHWDIGAFKWWGVTLIFNVMFIVMHVANYPGEPNRPLYLFLVLGINLPWTLSCVRNSIVVPSNPQTRLFVVIYDVLVTKPFFRNHVALMAASMAGFQSSPFFTLMLMDIVNNSRILANIILSITMPADKLGVVFYTIVCTVVIYAQFGLEFFGDHFSFDTDDDEMKDGCFSVVSCFWLILYKGVPANSVSEVMKPLNSKDPDFLPRVLYDLSFFVWVGVLLFDILTGLIVDAFGTLRNEENVRESTLTNECFICGFARPVYDEVAGKLVQGPSFDDHNTFEHDLWNYVFFYRHLEVKDSTEFNGVESYVAAMIAEDNLSWLPLRTSLALQSAGLIDAGPSSKGKGGPGGSEAGGGGASAGDGGGDHGGGGGGREGGGSSGGMEAAVAQSVRGEVSQISKTLLAAVDLRIEALERAAAAAAAE